MAETNKIEKIIQELKILNQYGQLEILEQLVKMIKKSQAKIKTRKYSIADLHGRGKEVWQHNNADEYIRKERDSWN